MSKRRKGNDSFLIIILRDLRHPAFLALTPAQRILYLELLAMGSYQLRKRPETGDRVRESYALIKQNTGLSLQTIADGLKILERRGFIRRVGEPFTLGRGWNRTPAEYEFINDWKLDAQNEVPVIPLREAQ